jgi:RNA polymerase sigma-70 factor (ECF subfamily)
MDDDALNQRLSQIVTRWSMIRQAHQGPGDEAASAQRELMQRYAGAVYRYLLRAVGDPDVADDLAQEFAYRFVRGDFRQADPQRGRFRNFIKTVALNLVVDYYRRKRARPQTLPGDQLETVVGQDDLDRQFLESWRHDLLVRAWAALARFQVQSEQPFYAVLRLRADRPELRSAQMAEYLSEQLGKPITAGAVRQTLRRARDKFGELLLDEVAHSLSAPTTEHLVEELSELGLLDYCRPCLERRGRV